MFVFPGHMNSALEFTGPVSPELRLLLACARIRPTPAEEDAIREILESGIDWVRFAQLAVDQGLAGFSGQTLCRVGGERVPDDLRDAIRVMIERTRKSNSVLFNEFVTIIERLRSNVIETIPIKDLVIAMQIYEDLGLRIVRALDFLVQDSDFATTIAALDHLGYQREGSLTAAQLRLIRRIEGRDFLVNKKKQIVVRPHTRITPLHLAVNIDYAGMWPRAKSTSVENQRLTLFAPEDQLLALVVQGGKEFWRPVLSVCDVAAFIRCHPELDWAAVVERARAQGCLRMSIVALSLARRFFDADLPEAISAFERNDKLVDRLTARIVAGWEEQGERPRRGKFSKDMIFLHGGPRRRAQYVARSFLLPEPADVRRVALPRPLHAAYAPLAIAHDLVVLRGQKIQRAVSERLAIRSRRRAAPKQSWDFAEARGEVLPEQAEYEKSRASALDILHADSRNVEALYELARALLGFDRFDDAIAAYERIIEFAPQHIRAKEELAGVLIIKMRPKDAIRMIKEVIAVDPNSAKAYSILGDALRRLSRYDEAAAAYKKALELRPSSAGTTGGLGLIFLETGELERARQLFAEAMEQEPDNAGVLYNVAHAQKVAIGDPVLKNLESMNARAASLRPGIREIMHFALAKAYQDTGDPKRGFDHLLEGNALRRRRVNYDEEETLENLKRIRQFFQRSLFAGRRVFGNPGDTPVFVIGMPRSGSTLIEQVVASHSGAFGAGELETFPQLLAERGIWRQGQSIREKELAALTSPDSLRWIGQEYLQRVTNRAPHAARIVDKQLGNFAYAGLIHLALPNAKIIHARRDPVDTCLSSFMQTFNEGSLEFTYDLGELGRYYQAYRKLMEHWKAVLPANVMLEVDYETLVRDFEKTARKIIAHCGLEWDDACLAFHETRKPVRTASIVQVRQPLYQTSIGRWRPDEEVLRPLLEGLGADDLVHG